MNPPIRPGPRRLSQMEIAELLAGDHVARLATVGDEGYPDVTPLWFLYDQGSFYLASDADRPHLARIRSNP